MVDKDVQEMAWTREKTAVVVHLHLHLHSNLELVPFPKKLVIFWAIVQFDHRIHNIVRIITK